MYSVGDTIVYGKEGVCTVTKIDSMNIAGIDKNKKYYYLAPLFSSGTIYVPVDTNIFIRDVISKDKALNLIDNINDIEVTPFNCTNIRLIIEHYQEMIKNYECEDLIKLIKEIYHKKFILAEKGRHLGTVDEKYLYKAEQILYGELSVAIGKSIDEVEKIIKSKLI